MKLSKLITSGFSLTLLMAAVGGRPAAGAEDVATFAQVAKVPPAVPGAPKYSDVTVRNLRPHPIPGKPDEHDTLRMVDEFHVTRLEWTYELTALFVRELKSRGLTVGGAIEDDPGSRSKLGRVTGQDGSFVTHKWFPKDRLIGCANAPEFRAAWLAEATLAVDAGADLMQQDDPQMAVRANPPFCYCAYCRAAFEKWGRDRSGAAAADYGQFQRESVLAFHRDMHAALDAHAGRHVPFSHNGMSVPAGKVDWVAPAFDFVNAEIDGKATRPAAFWALVNANRPTPMVFSHRETSVARNRRFLALTYATGTWMMLPWDVYMPNNQPRYFGEARDYADLSGFVHASAPLLDGYEDAAAAGPGITETRYGGNPPLALAGGSGEACAFARAKPGSPASPVVVHLVEEADEPKPLTLAIRTDCLGFSAVASVEWREPVAYDAALHQSAQRTRDFRPLSRTTALPWRREAGRLTVDLPPAHPWGILVISPVQP